MIPKFLQLIQFASLFHFVTISSQNLVLNPGFEKFKCERWYNSSIELCDDWSSPNLNSPDYFTNSCPGYVVASVVPNKWWGYQLPAEGNAFAGFIAYRPQEESEFSSPGTEYLQGSLSESLVTGLKYIFRLRISLSESSGLALKNLDVYFSETKTDTRKIKVLSFKPDFVIPVTNDTSNWVTVQSSFIAKGNENYFIIGCFDNGTKPKSKKVNPSKEITHPRTEAYYYVDDFEIFLEDSKSSLPKKNSETEDILAADTKIVEPELPQLKPAIGERTILKNIFFDTDKSELLSASFKELDALSTYLINNVQLSIQITGYTDSKGHAEENLILSEKRAFAVYTYFEQKGIHPSRMSYSGLGDKDPVSDNTTEKGRALNRRVEFKLNEN